MSTYFISDLHLHTNEPKVLAIFLQFLREITYKADALYILGDLFEVWVGDDDNSTLAHTVRTALLALTDSGVPVFFMRGNRDFAISQRFAKQTGITLLNDPSVVNIYGEKILLLHGDLLCIDDVQYQAFRHRIYSTNLVSRLTKLPLWNRRLLARWARYKSRKHTGNTDLKIQDINLQEMEKYFTQYGVTRMIHGHTHRPNEHVYDIKGQSYIRWVLAAWHGSGEALIFHRDGKIQRMPLLQDE